MRVLIFLWLSLAAWTCAADPLQLGVRSLQVRQPLFSLFTSPGEIVRVTHAYGPSTLEVLHGDQVAVELSSDSWELTAPARPGLYPVQVRHPASADETLLNVWVGVPREEMKGEYLNGYRIGRYPPPRTNRLNYEPPTSFIEITPDNIDAMLSPHFSLRQFVSKQASDFPRYVVIRESLLVLLERLLVDVQVAGYPVETFGIISGYRTPYYNQKIGNVPYSRHIYGSAMDIFIDSDLDGRMDDLNADGIHNRADTERFYRIVDDFKKRNQSSVLRGGIGRYPPTSRHGGFVHVDTRGYDARW